MECYYYETMAMSPLAQKKTQDLPKYETTQRNSDGRVIVCEGQLKL